MLRKLQVPSVTQATTVSLTTVREGPISSIVPKSLTESPPKPKCKHLFVLVDDSIINLKVLHSILRQCGDFSVESFDTPSKVVTRACEAKDEDIHCIFTDCIMPVVTGSQVTAAVR